MPMSLEKIQKNCLLVLILVLCPGVYNKIQANPYIPPGYDSNSNNTSYGASLGYSREGDDIYVTITPLLEFPLGKFKIGMQLPLRVLAQDDDGSTGQEVPSLDDRLYDSIEDLQRMIVYIKYGTHLYYDPEDTFNWSFHYGKLTDGYLGHKTIVYRYLNNYSRDVFRGGLMADINGNYGGIEHFSSDVYRKEVVGWRGYIRPWGLIVGTHNLFYASGQMPSLHQVALSVYNRDDIRNSGIFYQEKIPEQGRKGRVGQHFLPKMKDELSKNKVKFREVRDPVTGDTVIEPVPVDNRTDVQKVLDKKDKKSDAWEHGFWNRFAIGYSVVDDLNAPLNLEADGSGNLVIDPDTLTPRADDEENLRFTGYDAEFRLSPLRWLDITPYVDLNKIEEIENSEATHIGLDTLFKFSSFKITFRPEYREFSSNYIVTYFDSTHVIERTIYNPGGTGDSKTGSGSSNVTKLAYLKSLPDDGEKTKGYYGQLIFEWIETVIIETTYEDYDGPDNSVIFTGLYVPALADFYISAYYTKKNYDDLRKSFVYDDRSLVAAVIGYNLFSGITLSVSYTRTWEYNDDTSSFEPVDETSYNIGYSNIF